jgi:predicted nucleic acid-binding protein
LSTTLPTAFVVDASVFVADARPDEPAHSAAKALLRTIAERGVRLHIPMIALAEIAGAIARQTQDPGLALCIGSMYGQWPGIEVVPIDDDLGIAAARLSAEHFIRGCDALYVALAASRKATLVTLDRQQLERAPGAITTLRPAAALQALRDGMP